MKINIKDLPNYRDDMTAEKSWLLLEAHELPEADHTGYIRKLLSIRPRAKLADMKKAAETPHKMSRRNKQKQSGSQRGGARGASEQAKGQDCIREQGALFLALGYLTSWLLKPRRLLQTTTTAICHARSHITNGKGRLRPSC